MGEAGSSAPLHELGLGLDSVRRHGLDGGSGQIAGLVLREKDGAVVRDARHLPKGIETVDDAVFRYHQDGRLGPTVVSGVSTVRQKLCLYAHSLH